MYMYVCTYMYVGRLDVHVRVLKFVCTCWLMCCVVPGQIVIRLIQKPWVVPRWRSHLNVHTNLTIDHHTIASSKWCVGAYLYICTQRWVHTCILLDQCVSLTTVFPAGPSKYMYIQVYVYMHLHGAYMYVSTSPPG